MIKRFEPTPGRQPKIDFSNKEGVTELTLIGKFTDGLGEAVAGEVRLYFRHERRLEDWIERELPEAQRVFRQGQSPISVIMDVLEEVPEDDSYEDIAKLVIERLRGIRGVTLPPDRV